MSRQPNCLRADLLAHVRARSRNVETLGR
jgi:hypothetical protein